MDIESKLAEYRARKRRQAYLTKANETLKSFFTLRPKTEPMSLSPVENEAEHSEDKVLLINETECDKDNVSSDVESEDRDDCQISYITLVTYVLYFILWLTLFIIFIKLQFGLVFVVVSALLAIYFNTGTGPKRKNEVSAYSVFNKNCESIDGTLKAEQFEREIRYGSAAVH